MSITISPMTAQAVPQVAALESTSFSTPWSRRSIEEELSNPWALWLVAREGEALAGYLGVQYGPDGGDILTIATDPLFRGRGVARELLKAMSRLLREKGLEWLTLEVRPSNAAALRLYNTLGFRQVGRRPRYYRNPTEDAILMTLYFKEESHADFGN